MTPGPAGTSEEGSEKEAMPLAVSRREAVWSPRRSARERVGREGQVLLDGLGLAQDGPRLLIQGLLRFLHQLPQAAQGGSGLVGLTQAVLRQSQKGQVRGDRTVRG